MGLAELRGPENEGQQDAGMKLQVAAGGLNAPGAVPLQTPQMRSSSRKPLHEKQQHQLDPC